MIIKSFNLNELKTSKAKLILLYGTNEGHKEEVIKKGITNIESGQYKYPITYQLIKDGRKNILLSKKINSKIKISMIHGQKDEVVPVSFSRKVLAIFTKAKKKLMVIKNGDHSLSDKKSLNKIIKELNRMVIDIV